MNSLTKTVNQLEFFQENGYAGPFSLPSSSLTTENLLLAMESSQKLFKGVIDKGLDRLVFYRKHHIFYHHVFALVTEDCILEDVANILGPNLLLWIAEMRPRHPNNKGQAWHIDQANYQVGGVHVSIAINEMNQQNGCLQVIPKTHQYHISSQELAERSRKGECNLNNAESMALLADKLHPENAPHQVVSAEMKGGQYFFTKGGLWHGVPPNSSQGTRFSCLARYMTPDVPSHLPSILVKGVDDYNLNTLYKPPSKVLANNLLFNSLINASHGNNFKLSFQSLVNRFKLWTP